jgi:hypothetical protein
VLEQLVEDLGGGALAQKLLGNQRDRGLEHLAQPAAGSGAVGDRRLRRAVQLRAVRGNVVEQPPRLVLLRVEPGES